MLELVFFLYFDNCWHEHIHSNASKKCIFNFISKLPRPTADKILNINTSRRKKNQKEEKNNDNFNSKL